MESFNIILAIILLVFGILQIILFFKIWGMTNDIRKIKDKFRCEEIDDWEIKKALILDDKEKARTELMNLMLKDIEIQMSNKFDRFWDLKSLKEYYKEPFKILEMEFPEMISNANKIEDINNLMPFKRDNSK